ncbi:MAG TPA: hypothetical protein VK203_27110 [Nostocaceae cyanobacterium]|nr:hypothetical protein [Nostocaceae cyanobacterium]
MSQRGLGGFPHERLANPEGDWRKRREEAIVNHQLLIFQYVK